MKYVLENHVASMTIDSFACQVTSFVRKDTGIEYMWQADEKYWSGRNPTLFPHVSASKNKVLIFKNKEYKVGNHGFARRSEFSLVEQNTDSITFKLSDNVNTYQEYPYHFDLFMKYRLVDDVVTINYAIINKDEEIMPFGFGLHPAFNCPLTSDKVFEDYWVEFDNGDKYPLNYQDLKQVETKIYRNIDFSKAVLTDGKHGVEMNFKGFRHFALWSAMGPFICLEPWMNQIDNKKDWPMPFEEIEGIDKLEPNQKFEIGYSYRIF